MMLNLTLFVFAETRIVRIVVVLQVVVNGPISAELGSSDVVLRREF